MNAAVILVVLVLNVQIRKVVTRAVVQEATKEILHLKQVVLMSTNVGDQSHLVVKEHNALTRKVDTIANVQKVIQEILRLVV